MGGEKKVEETDQQRAFADVMRAKMVDFNTRWKPVLQRFAAHAQRSMDPNSYEHRRAAGMATTDNAAAFAPAKEKLVASEAAKGAFGSARQKLGLAEMDLDQATSGAMAETNTQQAVDDAALQQMGAAAAMGRGQQATAVNGMRTAADISGRQAAQDAQTALNERIGEVGLAAQAGGMAVGLAAGVPKAPTTDQPVELPYQLRGQNKY